MAENTTPARISESDYEAARAAGLLIVTVAEELAVHKFAEAIREQAVAACKSVLDEKEEGRAERVSLEARGTPDEVARLRHLAMVRTYNAGVRRCIAAIMRPALPA